MIRAFLIILLCGAATGFAAPPFAEIKAKYQVSDYSLLDRHGVVLQKARANFSSRQLDWVSLAEVSPRFKEALIFLEDRRFRAHGGVDYRALVHAFWQNTFSRKNKRGASTITMQLAGLLNPNLNSRRGRRSLWQKIYQLREAWDLEASWSKDQILEAYVNFVSFHGDKRGLRSASQLLLGKDPHGLTGPEAFFLASRIQSPSRGGEAQRSRTCALYRKFETGHQCQEIDALFAATPAAVLRRSSLASPTLAYHLLARLKGGDTRGIVSSLDRDIQEYAVEMLQGQLSSLKEKNVRDGAIVVLENRTGLVRAYVGNVGEGSTAKFVDGVTALRQAGSTLKPFVFATAFEKEIIKPETLLDDSPTEMAIEGAQGVYRPQNYDNQFHGWVSARQALASSLNVPAVKVFLLVGAEVIVKKMTGLGFTDLRRAEDYGPSLALGSADVSLLELTNAYRALSNRGEFTPVRFKESDVITAGQAVFTPKAVALVTSILSDRQDRSLTFGLENSLSTRRFSAVKTGTSQDMRDNWCVGYGENYTVGVWVGNLSGEPMWNVSGVTGAAPLWSALMNRLEGDKTVVAKSAVSATARPELKPIAHRKISRLLYPTEGLIVALDPDIPRDRQRLFFEVQGMERGLKVELDGNPLSETRHLLNEGWSPRNGVHHAVLRDKDGRVRDRVAFEVRGRIYERVGKFESGGG